MINKLKLPILSLLLVCVVHAQDFTATQKEAIATKTNSLLEDYLKYGSLSMDGQQISVLYLNKYTNLFKNTTSVYVFNDIDPEETMADYITIGEYILKVQSWYPAGLDIDLNWNIALISDPVLTDPDNTYTVFIVAEKKVMGIHQQQKIHTGMSDQYFVVEFQKVKNNVTNFSISGIQKNRPEIQAYTEDMDAVSVKRSNVNLSLLFEPIFSRIYNKSMYSNEDWEVSGETGFITGLGFQFRLNDHFNIITGLGISKYNTSLFLDTLVNHENTTLLTDKDDDLYYRYFQAGNIEETNSLTYIEIPVGIGIQKELGKKIIAYLNTGIEFSLLISGRYSATGFSSHTGYYPELHVVLYDLPEYDFTTEKIDKDDDWDVNPINISAFIEMGINYKISNLVSFQIGPTFSLGLSDIQYDTPKHRDDYVSTIGPPGKTTLQAWGVNFAIVFKL